MQRGEVGPLGVVDEQGSRSARGEIGGQPVEAMLDREGIATLTRRLGVEDRGGQSSAAPQQLGTQLGVAQRRLEELAYHPVGEVALVLAAARPQDAHLGCVAKGSGGVEQGGLAGARFALDREDLARAAAGGVQQGLDRRELIIPLQQCGSRRHLLQSRS